jgi:hypothetical protein
MIIMSSLFCSVSRIAVLPVAERYQIRSPSRYFPLGLCAG